MTPLQAAILGIVEGITEFLPVSSTGHLILASKLMRMSGESVKSFEVIIQGGALAAVLGLYRHRIGQMWRGITGRDLAGRRLFLNLCISFLPAAIAGLLCHRFIKEYLFSTGAVILALAAGGVLMIAMDRYGKNGDCPCFLGSPLGEAEGTVPIFEMSHHQALLIGLAQVLSLWPGTSRSMVTILAALLLGLTPAAAAEYSFLLALPTLGAAVLFDAFQGGKELIGGISVGSFTIGVIVSALVAVVSIRSFLSYLTRHGLAPFGWYRIVLAVLVWIFVK
ncbi:MAG: undecaprenyl-diphosphate phosphatase [Candidatus Omnitrophica bacterium]|nr:undecaprenyl-diphosphate phosphatase [Candidatus Omnitrophota bacterium]